jgi:GAF domain
MGRTLIEGKAMQVPDVLADPEYMYLDHQKKTGVRTLLGVPLLREGSPIGVVLLGSAGDTRTLAVHGLRIATHCPSARKRRSARPPRSKMTTGEATRRSNRCTDGRSIAGGQRGTGEGHRSWDLMPNSTMTNATIAQMVKGVEGSPARRRAGGCVLRAAFPARRAQSVRE